MQTDRAGKSYLGFRCLHDHFRLSQSDFQTADQFQYLGFIDFPIPADHDRHWFAVNVVNQSLDEPLGILLQKFRHFFNRPGVRRFH